MYIQKFTSTKGGMKKEAERKKEIRGEREGEKEEEKRY